MLLGMGLWLLTTSTTFYKVSTGYMFWPSWAIIRPYIWTGSFDFSAFCKAWWWPKRAETCSLWILCKRL